MDVDARNHKKSFTIKVNKKNVEMFDHSATGAQIKQAAITAGVEIQFNFQLVELKEKNRQIIGDNDTVGIHEGSDFIATAPDDNSSL